MKYLIILFSLSICFLISCGPSAEELAAMEKCRMEELATEELIREHLKTTFESPFPKRNRNLSKILGDTLYIQGNCGPIGYKIVSKRKHNLIINIETGDTIFKGTVCKYRDLYYLNEQLNDTSFRISALKITDSLLYGLQSYFQYSQIDSAIENGYYLKLLKYKDDNKKLIRLHPDKKELRKLFTTILFHTKPFEIMNKKVGSVSSNDTEDITDPIEPGDYELFSKVYPNPATDIINIVFEHKIKSTFQVTDMSGKMVLQGQLDEFENKIDISKQATGIYALTIINTANKKTETVKIVKTK